MKTKKDEIKEMSNFLEGSNPSVVSPSDFNKDEMEEVRDFVSGFIIDIGNVSKNVSKRTGKPDGGLPNAKRLAFAFIPRNR